MFNFSGIMTPNSASVTLQSKINITMKLTSETGD